MLLAFHRDGRRLISSAMTPTVRVWDVATTSETAQSGKLSSSAAYAMYRNDGDEILISAGTSVTIWNSKTDAEICQFTLDCLAVAMDCSHDGKLLLIGGQDGTVRVWDLDERREIQVLAGHQGLVNHVQFSRDGRTIVSGGYDLTIRVWDRRSQRTYETLLGHELGISGLGFLTDKEIVSADTTGVRAWKLTFDANHHLHKSLIFHDGVLNDGGTKLGIPIQNSIQLRECATGLPCDSVSFASKICSCDMQGNFSLLAVGCQDGSVQIMNAAQRSAPLRLTGFESLVSGVRLSRDGRFVAAASDRELRVWRLSQERGGLLEAPPLMFSRAAASHRDVCFSPDGERLYVSGAASRLHVLETATGQVVDEWVIPRLTGTVLAMTPDGRTLAVTTMPSFIELWDVGQHRRLSVLSGHSAAIQSLAFSPDGSRLASGGSDRTVRIWAVAEAQEVLCFGGHPGNINCVKFSGDGSSLAVVGYLGTAMIYRAGQ